MKSQLMERQRPPIAKGDWRDLESGVKAFTEKKSKENKDLFGHERSLVVFSL